jgi:NAD(P)-dependent dehydrogenase (short-subunit alcohol dehydrogenase family)
MVPSHRLRESGGMSVLASLRPAPGLRVLVTGGASGIGAAIGRAFVEAGARVHVCDVDRAALDRLATDTPGITASMADVANERDVDLVHDDVAGTLGGLDVLVNNAGVAGPTGAIETLAPNHWERTVAVNLRGQFLFARRAVPLLKASRANPCIVAVASVAGRLGHAYHTPYAATQWAVVGLVKSLAMELGPHGVRVNAILPGLVQGERTDDLIAARAAATGRSVQAMRQDSLRGISLRRMVSAADVAACALYLCSPAACNVTGQAVSIDGNVEHL